MELRLKFNEDADNYDKWRPAYVPELFEEIIRYCVLDEKARALEIGIGTGQATEPILKTGCHVTAIELGGNLWRYVRTKFRQVQRFEALHLDFSDFEAAFNTYDLVYSATAFHWIPPEIGYRRVYDLLKPGGTVALFWNHPFVNRVDDPLHQEIQRVYQRYRPSNKVLTEFQAADCAQVQDALERYGFADCGATLFYQTRAFGPQEYLALLNTYSDHRALPIPIKDALEKEIAQAIERSGGILKVYDTMDLYLARKPGR